MYNQTEAILSQYEIEIHEVTKGRGNFICDTNIGKMLLVPFRGSNEKGRLLYQFLAVLQEKGFPVEQIYLTQNGEALSEDEYTGERFILKNYIEGAEINAGKVEEVKGAVRALANYHKIVEQVQMEVGTQKPAEIAEALQRHYRELIKVRNYIRNRKKKNEFEQLYMKHFEHSRKLAEDSILMLKEGEGKIFCHGDVNQHNILVVNGTYRMVNFENVTYSWAMTDVANFLRKMLEKNEWNIEFGLDIIKEYDNYRHVSTEEYRQLYGLLLFPEKFWKITNHYINSRKTWISGRDIDKLAKVIEQEEKRLNFMENLFAFLK